MSGKDAERGSRATILPVNDSSAGSSKREGCILVLEPDESLVSSILSALHEAAPAAVLEVARNLEEAHRIVLKQSA